VVRVRSVAATVSADASQPGLLIALDARIPGLLLAGLTDQAVANQLNLSMRMVQLRVRGSWTWSPPIPVCNWASTLREKGGSDARSGSTRGKPPYRDGPNSRRLGRDDRAGWGR